MIVEVVAVGTELLLGQIVNGNAAHIGARLAEEGHDAHFQTVVGDNVGRIAAAIDVAVRRSDAVILTGGLGPTQDDLTREGVAEATGRDLVFDQDVADRLRDWFTARGRTMADANLRQAWRPRGSVWLPNPKGTAPGLFVEEGAVRIFALPGVPAEMSLMLDEQVLPRLREGTVGVIRSRLLRTWGLSESKVAELLGDLYGPSNPSLAFLASGGEIKVRITAKAQDDTAAEALIAPVEAEVRRRLGPVVFGADADTVEVVLLRLLSERAWTLGTAESMTGGMVAARITTVAGASKVFRGAAVTYATDLKRRLLGVPQAVLDAGVVSAPTATAMADGAAERLGVDVAVSITGSAGPDPQERPAGTVFVGVHVPGETRARELHLPGDRERVRTFATTAALHLARRAILGEWW